MKDINKKIVAIIQARCGSTRLPSKVLRKLAGQPMLAHVVNRAKLAKNITDVIIATTRQPADDDIVQLCRKRGWSYFRGSEADVLDRYYQAALKYQAPVIVRITSDCPLIDPRVTDSAVKAHLNSGADYTSLNTKSGFPRGLDTEVFSFEALEKTHREARKDYEREHVTPYIYEHSDKFKVQSVKATGKLKRPDLRLTVDTEEDFRLIEEIYRHLYRNDRIFYTEEVIDLLDKHPELTAINAHVKQKIPGQ
jgi:spore coat polysaccharide biosynthesis protein SpsF